MREPPIGDKSWRIWLAAGIILVAALAAYHNSFSVPFIFDDPQAILQNPTITGLVRSLSPPVRSTVAGRPLLNASFGVNYALGGYRVQGYHGLNLLIHALAAMTLFGLTRRTLSRPAFNGRFAKASLAMALSVALIWTVHPVQTESVTYVSQRAELLMGLFYLSTVYFFVRSTDSKRTGLWLALSVIACLLGALSKEVIVTAPIMVLLYDRAFVAGSFREAWRQRWCYYLGLCATWLVLAYLLAAHPVNFGYDQGVGSGAYALTSCRSMATYLRLALWPHPLVLDYGPDILRNVADAAPYVLGMLLLLGLTAAAVIRRKSVGFAAAWFFVILAPTTSILPIALQPMAENRVYLPVAGLITIGVCTIYSWLGQRALIVFAVAAVGLGWMTIERNNDYRDVLSINTDTVEKRPGNARAHINLGFALSRMPGRQEEAISHYVAALKINPRSAEYHDKFGMALAEMPGRLPDAIAEFETAIELIPNYPEAHNHLGLALAKDPQRLQEAIAHYETALRIWPDYAEAYVNLGNALARIPGRIPEAIEQFRSALKIDPGYADAHNSLGIALARTPDGLPEAIIEIEAALRLHPDDVKLQKNLEIVRKVRDLRAGQGTPR